MSKIGRKITSIALSLTTTFWLVGAGTLVPMAAHGQTVADLQAQINLLLAQISALQTQLAQVQGGGVAVSCSFSRNLTVGSTGSDVLCLQQYLNSAGYQLAASGAGSPGNETQYFGPITRAAVIKWQNANAASVLTPVGLSVGTGFWGPSSISHFNSLAAAPAPAPAPGPGVPAPVPAPAGTLAVSAGSQPSASLFPQNAARVPFTTVVFTAPLGQDVTVDSLTVERTGLANDAVFDGIVLLDENGVQLGLAKTLNSVHQAILSEDFVVSAGTSRTLTLAGNAPASLSSYAGQVAFLSLVGVNATHPVSGSLPITGVGHTVNSSLSIGSVTIARGPLDPGDASPSKKVGTTGYTFSSVKVTAGSAEKVYLRSIRWNQTGSVGSGDLVNVMTYVDGTSYPHTISSDGKYYTAVFGDNGGKGILIDKGFSKEVYIQGDIEGGSGRTVDFDIAKRTDISLLGENYGYGIIPPQTGSSVPTADTAAFSSSEDPWYDADQVDVSGGSLTVANSNTEPAQNIAINLADQPLGSLLVTVKGEEITVGRIGFNITLGSEGSNDDVDDITNVILVNSSGAIVAGPVDGTAADSSNTSGFGDGSIVFTDTVTFPVGENVYILKGKIGTDIDNNVTVQASTTPSNDWATVTGQTTGNSITPSPSSALTLNQMTVKAGSLAVSVSSVPIAQTVIAGSQGFLFGQYILDATASGEDVRLTNIPLEIAVGGGTSDLTACALYDGSSAVTSTKDITANASGTSFTFSSGGLTVPKGTTKTIGAKCNVASGATSAYFWGLDSTQTNTTNWTGISGLTSGETISQTVTAGVGQKMTSATGGSLAVTLDASSPTYSLVSPGQTIELARIRFQATNEDIDLRRVALQLSGVASNSPDNLVDRQVTLHTTDGVQIGAAVFPTSDFATSSQIDSGAFRVPRDGSKILVVKGVLGGISVSGPTISSGEFLKVDYDGDATGLANGNYGVGLSSGTNITPTGGDTAVGGVRIMKGYPTLARIDLGGPTLVNGIQPILRWSVTANGGDVAIGKFTLRIATTSVVASSLNVFAYTDSGFSSPVSGVTSGGQLQNTDENLSTAWADNTSDLEIDVDDSAGTDTVLQIPVGQTRYFEARVNITGADASGDTISTQLQGDANSYSNSSAQMAGFTVVDAFQDNDLLWASNATTTALRANQDWTNGFGVIGLPSTNMTAQVLSR